MTQSHPQNYPHHLRRFLIFAATSMIAMGVIQTQVSLTNPTSLRAQTPSGEILQAAPTGVSDTPESSATEESAETKTTETTDGSESSTNDEANSNRQIDAEESESETEAANADESLIGNFFRTPPVGYLLQGGLFMWPILIMGIIGAGVIIERYRSLNMLSGDSKQLRTDVQSLLETNQVRQAFELCKKNQGPVPAILATGLRKYLVLQTLEYEPAKIEEQVVKSMDDYSVHIVAALERHLPILATISSAAPMLGFLGTVQGMIVAFDDIVAKMGETNIVEAAAVGIKVSLMTTCFGLIVGIPAFVAFNYFTGIINRFVLDVEESATEMIEAVTLQTAITTADSKHRGEPQP
ncbi:MotA/TolQ/ExbB proton channel family protein [Rubripirellula sp.]|nr:MotA/TolQ/ExbB proton channel family protein [Rubripirellula sp.]MDA7874763.1 MotA/TolQ/ExbB proton channel family protein [Rhodopirellula sp.]MDB4644612.1 MotA/TolQ/ExbB proton channel family protein [Rubripirellula sp.]MDB4770943.1 MotA/TolQ/ExbB proton channel family protein [bacterium]